MPDPIRTNVLVTASYGHYGQRAARIGPYCICLIRLPTSDSVPFFPQTMTLLCKTDPGPIWMAWSGFDQTHQILKQAGVRESSGPVSGRTQQARYQFPAFRFGCVLPQTARFILCKTRPDPIWFWLTVSGFGQTDPVRKQVDVQESPGPHLANAALPIRTGCESDPACLLGYSIGVLPDCAIPCKPDTFLCAWLADTDATALDPTSQNRERNCESFVLIPCKTCCCIDNTEGISTVE